MNVVTKCVVDVLIDDGWHTGTQHCGMVVCVHKLIVTKRMPPMLSHRYSQIILLKSQCVWLLSCTDIQQFK